MVCLDLYCGANVGMEKGRFGFVLQGNFRVELEEGRFKFVLRGTCWDGIR